MRVRIIIICLLALACVSCQKTEQRTNPFEGRTFYCNQDESLWMEFHSDGTVTVRRYYSILNGEEYQGLLQVMTSEDWQWSYSNGELSLIPEKWATFGYRPFRYEVFFTDYEWKDNYIVFDCYCQDRIAYDNGWISSETTYYFRWK